MNLQLSLADLDEGTFSIFRAPHCDPPITSRQASRFEGDKGYTLALLRGDVNHIDNSLDDDIDAIGIGGADVVAKLGVATDQFNRVSAGTSNGVDGYTDKLGILKGKKRRLFGRTRDSVGRCLRQRWCQ